MILMPYFLVTHLQEVTYIVKPMATLIIIRRLHLIVSLQSVDILSQATVCALRLDTAMKLIFYVRGDGTYL